MKNIIYIIVMLFFPSLLSAQGLFDQKQLEQNNNLNSTIQTELIPEGKAYWKGLLNNASTITQATALDYNAIQQIQIDEQQQAQVKFEEDLLILHKDEGEIYFAEVIELKPTAVSNQRDAENIAINFIIRNADRLGLQANDDQSFNLRTSNIDTKGNYHVRFDQRLNNIPVWASDVVVHIHPTNGVFAFNGRYLQNVEMQFSNPSIQKEKAIENVAQSFGTDLASLEANYQPQMAFLAKHLLPEATLMYWKDEENPDLRLVYEVVFSPSIYEHFHCFIDANTGELIKKVNDVCGLGPETANASDLFGVNRTINVWSESGSFFMVDGSRPNFNLSASDMPDNPVGGLVTLNLNNNDVDQSGTWVNQLSHVSSSNNSWNNPTAVSAHYNAGVCYDYFRNTFNRNALDGNGGTIWSVINVAAPSGGGFDNAFWNGTAMFYGNGNQQFIQLPKALDVAAHEMTHGVIQNTANLVYQFQPGALNESFADVFGAMVDRDDWQLAEDVANPSFFPTGAMRDMQNPNNGANSISQAGYQPAHMNQYLQLNSNQDNGGVHVNSGIPNRACFLFASQVGRNTAEQVYYHALNNYLTQSSQFVDCRAAIIQSSNDLFDSSVANAATSAFDQVGIVGSGNIDPGGGGTTSGGDLPTLSGTEHIVVAEKYGNNQTETFYDYNVTAGTFKQVSNGTAFAKPSIVDDGSICVFVGSDNNIYITDLNYSDPAASAQALTNDGNWRKVAISRDGFLLAALTTNQTNAVTIFTTDNSQTFTLTNPSTSSDGSTGGAPEYADAIEFDPLGEYLMYDAFNLVNTTGGSQVGVWDIGIVRVWNKGSNNFGDGNIFKLFPPQPNNISIGNASFSKNSPYIITFDLLDSSSDEEYVMAANLNTGESNAIYQTNNIIAYPTYSALDDAIAFSDFYNGQFIVGAIPIGTDKISASGNPYIYFNDAAWPVWYMQGQRNWQTPQADFSANTTNGPASLTVNFTDESNNSPTEWSWTFQSGNPASSTEQNPVVTFANPGTYNVSLTATNEAGSDNETKNSYITVGQPVSIEEEFLSAGFEVYPNPFSVQTQFNFVLNKTQEINLTIYDLQGNLIHEAASGLFTEGLHQIQWNAEDWPKGIYYYQFTGDEINTNGKLVIQ